MNPDPAGPAPRPVSFLREGLREVGRKLHRGRLRRQMGQQGRERDEALVELGRKAWDAQTDLSAHPQLRDLLSQLQESASELSETARDLDARKVEAEKERRAEEAKHDAGLRPVKQQKETLDRRLQEAEQRQRDQERTVGTGEARLAAMNRALAGLEQEPAGRAGGATGGTAGEGAAPRERRPELLAEQAQVKEALAAARAALDTLAAELPGLRQERERSQHEITRLEAQRREALERVDAELARLRKDLSAAAGKSREIQQERRTAFRDLGVALVEARPTNPALAPALKGVLAADDARQTTGAALDASLTLSRAMPRGTMRNSGPRCSSSRRSWSAPPTARSGGWRRSARKPAARVPPPPPGRLQRRAR